MGTIAKKRLRWQTLLALLAVGAALVVANVRGWGEPEVQPHGEIWPWTIPVDPAATWKHGWPFTFMTRPCWPGLDPEVGWWKRSRWPSPSLYDIAPDGFRTLPLCLNFVLATCILASTGYATQLLVTRRSAVKRRGPFQFSLRTMLLLMGATAVLLSVWRLDPDLQQTPGSLKEAISYVLMWLMLGLLGYGTVCTLIAIGAFIYWWAHHGWPRDRCGTAGRAS